MGLPSSGLEIGIFSDFLFSVLLLDAILGLVFLRPALSQPQVEGEGSVVAPQSGLALHCDGSLLSFNLLLNNPGDFEGGGTFFETSGETHHLARGDALLHCGKLRHAGAPVLHGLRVILVGFIDPS